MTLLLEGQAPRLGSRRISTHITLVALVLAAIAATRLLALGYNTASAAEAADLAVGQRVLRYGVGSATRAEGGSLLYPLVSALAAQVGGAGLHGARVLAVLTTLSAAFGVYWLARQVFGAAAALLALIIFGFTGVSVFSGTQASADSLALALLGAAAALLAAALARPRGRAARARTAGAAACFALAVLAVYDVLVWGGVLALLWLALLARRDWARLRLLSFGFVLPVALALGAYAALSGGIIFRSAALAQPQALAPLDVLRQLSYALRLPFVVALFGTGYELVARRTGDARAGLLWAAALVLPLGWLAGLGARALPPTPTYALLFLAPLAGRGAQRMLALTPRDGLRQLTVIGLSVVYMLVTFQVWNDQTWLMQRAWPSAQPTVAFLRALPVSPTTRVLAEDASIYDYYLGWDAPTQLTEATSRAFRHGGQQGTAALTAALNDHYFDYVVLDGYAAPELSAQLAAAAQRAGYQAAFQDAQTVPGVREHIFTLTVYRRPG